MNSISNGLGNGCLTGKLLITSVLRQFAGPSGNAIIKQSLMPNSTGTPAEILLHMCFHELLGRTLHYGLPGEALGRSQDATGVCTQGIGVASWRVPCEFDVAVA